MLVKYAPGIPLGGPLIQCLETHMCDSDMGLLSLMNSLWRQDPVGV